MTFKEYLYIPQKNLPKDGWMQSCINFGNITANTECLNKTFTTEYIIYLCKSCQKKKDLINEKYILKIKKHFNIH